MVLKNLGGKRRRSLGETVHTVSRQQPELIPVIPSQCSAGRPWQSDSQALFIETLPGAVATRTPQVF